MDFSQYPSDTWTFLKRFTPFSQGHIKALFRVVACAALSAQSGEDAPDPIALLARVRTEAQERLACPWSADRYGGTQRALTIWALHRCAMFEVLILLETDPEGARSYAAYKLDRAADALESRRTFEERMSSLPPTERELDCLRAAGYAGTPTTALEVLQAIDELIAPQRTQERRKCMLGVWIDPELHTQLWGASLERGQTISDIVRETLTTSLQPQRGRPFPNAWAA